MTLPSVVTSIRINKLELELVKNYSKSLGTTSSALMRELAVEAAKRAATAGNGLGFDEQDQCNMM